MLQIEAALRLVAQRLQFGRVLKLRLPQASRLGWLADLAIAGRPSAAVFLLEAHAQRIVMGQQRLQRAVEHVAVQGLSGLEQKGLVPVVTIGDVFVEECLVNRQELHAPLHRA